MNPRCEKSAPIYNYDYDSSENSTYNVSYSIPGWKQSCSHMNSLILSNLKCLYSSDCLSRLVRDVKTLFISELWNQIRNPWFEPRPLVYNPTINRFYQNTSVKDILNKAMVENWNPSISYKKFYEICAPTHCTYTKRVRKKNLFQAIVAFISLIGGVVVAVRLIASFSVKLFLYLWKNRSVNRQTEEPGTNE